MIENNQDKRKIKANATRKKIYESAKLLFSKYGINDVSVDDIVGQAKVAKGSFYVHYKSKNELITILLADNTKMTDTVYKQFLDSLPSDMPITEVILAFIGKIADVLIQYIGSEIMSKIYQIGLEKNTATSAVVGYNRDLYHLFKELIVRGVNEGVFNVKSADEVAQHFVAAYRGITFEWCVRYPDFDLKNQALYHFNLLLNGIIERT